MLVSFAKSCDISYITLAVNKKHVSDPLDLTVALSRQLTVFIREEYDFFNQYDRIVVYYDNGQIELNKLLASVFAALLPQSEFRKVLPADYRLFQVADLFCTMELIKLKSENHLTSKTEDIFFGSNRYLKKNYLVPLQKKRHTNLADNK